MYKPLSVINVVHSGSDLLEISIFDSIRSRIKHLRNTFKNVGINMNKCLFFIDIIR